MGCGCNKQTNQNNQQNIKENIQALKEQRSMTENKNVAISFTHGCGDCVHFACVLQLYKRRGFGVKVRVEDNKQFIWKVAEVEVTRESLPSHHWGYPSSFDDLNAADFEKNKVGWNLNKVPLPYLGSPKELWDELVNIELDATPYISEEARQEARNFVAGLEGPTVLLHTQGNTWIERKNLPQETIISLQTELIERNYNVIILDWDNRTPTISNPKIRNIKTWGKISLEKLAALYETADFLVGVDSCALHFARFSQIPCLGIWRHLHPCRCSLPSPRLYNLVTANHYKHWRSREDLWNLMYYEGSEPSAKAIVNAVDDVIHKKDRCDKWLSGKYIYHRVGYDQRTIHLLEDHTIGEGSAGRELFWLKAGDTLTIYGEDPTCHLKLVDDKWIGTWLHGEKMPIELMPVDKTGLQWEKISSEFQAGENEEEILSHCKELYQQVKELQPFTIVQLGLNNGYESWAMLEGYAKAWLLCIDTEPKKNDFISNLTDNRKFSLITVNVNDVKQLPKCDLCYINNYSSEEQFYKELMLAEASSRNILCNHYLEEGVKNCIMKLIKEKPYIKCIQINENLYLIKK